MHINKATVNAFLKQIDSPKTRGIYTSTIKQFSKYCNGRIDTDLAQGFLRAKKADGNSPKSLKCHASIINCLEKYADLGINTHRNTVTPKKSVKPAKPVAKLALPDTIVSAFDKCDEKALAFAISKLNEAYNKACDSVRNSTANMNWDATSWDEASARCKRAYDGLRRVRDVITLMDEMYQAKAGVRE